MAKREPFVTVLLGAGASADAGIPTTIDMTDAIIERTANAEYARLLYFVRDTIAADLARQVRPRREDVDVRVDVERLFASIDLLVDRYDQPWSPFVATWHPGLESFSPVPTLSSFDLSFELREFETALASALSTRGGTYSMGNALTKLLQKAGEECDTGIETWLARGEFGWSDARLRLLKLHGSIDWVVERGVNDRNKLPVTRIRKVAAAEATARSERPAVVFGEAGKLRSEGPYLELLLGFAAELNKADNLLIVGYSFRDKHVNEVIGRWFNADQHRRIVWVDPVDLETVEYRSFAWALTNVDRVFPGDQRRETSPEPPRFQHVQGPTAKALPAGVEAAAVGLFHAGHRGRAAS